MIPSITAPEKPASYKCVPLQLSEYSASSRTSRHAVLFFLHAFLAYLGVLIRSPLSNLPHSVHKHAPSTPYLLSLSLHTLTTRTSFPSLLSLSVVHVSDRSMRVVSYMYLPPIFPAAALSLSFSLSVSPTRPSIEVYFCFFYCHLFVHPSSLISTVCQSL